jgi:menaquinone-dependent protoporphyrinogen oxidase
MDGLSGTKIMKTLIIYATKYGSAQTCANLLKEKLVGDIQVVNIKTDSVPVLQDFEQVILGGSIYIGHIQKEIKAFSEQHLEILLTKKVGLFVCAGEENEQYNELKAAFPLQLYQHAAAKDVFGYETHLDRVTWFERQMLRLKGTTSSSSHLLYDNIEKFAVAMNG